MSTRVFGAFPTGYQEGDATFDIELKSIPEEYHIPNPPAVQNQGTQPICCAISIEEIISWQEKIRTNSADWKHFSVNDIYALRDSPSMQGMIPRNALMAMKDKGVDGYRIKHFSFVRNIEHAKAAILMNGPLLFCTMAYDRDDFWRPDGQSLGGHAVVLTGWDKNGFVLQNSWGVQYASGGTIEFPFSDWKYMSEAWTIEI